MIFVTDKPSGITSQTAVFRIRRHLDKKTKIGHTGTLDPMVTGVLPMLTGRDTHLADLLDGDKEYIAEFKLGTVTDTQDITGTVLEEHSVDGITEDDVKTVISSFVGEYEQLPPMYSAVKYKGKKLYELAREGIEVERKTRKVIFYEIEYEGCRDGIYRMRVACSKGTYIRTLIHDIGQRLGCGAVMTSLRRTRAGGFCISDAVSLECAEKSASDGELSKIAVPAEKCFLNCGSCIIPDDGLKYFVNGGVIALRRLSDIKQPADNLIRAYSSDGKFLGLCRFIRDGAKAVWIAE